MKCNKKNIVEYIGYFSIALVCVLSLVFSFGVVELYQQPIVAHAQVIDGVDYPSIPFESYELVFSTNTDQDGGQYDFYFYELFDETSMFVPLPYNLYCVSIYNFDLGASFVGYFYTSNNFTFYKIFGVSYPVVCSFSIGLVGVGDFTSNNCIIYYDDNNETYVLALEDIPGDFGNIDIDIYLVPNGEDASTPITDDIISIIADGMSFGYSSLADGVAYTMDNLFLDNGELSNFTILLVSILGIGLALGITKFVLRFIFSLGGMRKL